MIDPETVKIGDKFIYTVNSDKYDLELIEFSMNIYKFKWRKHPYNFQGIYSANSKIFSSKGSYYGTTIVRKENKELIVVNDPEFRNLYV